jgi:sugar phosphate isomerase/epimerase
MSNLHPNSVPEDNPTRRQFLRRTATAAAAIGCTATGVGRAAPGPQPASPERPRRAALKLGAASYSFRKFDLDRTIALTKQLGLEYLCLKSFHLPLDAKPQQIAVAVEKVRRAGLVLYGGGVISMHQEAEINQAFDYAKAAGMRVIVAAPSVAMLPAVERKVKQYDIAVAIHNHGPGDKIFPTPQSVYEKLTDFDKRIGLCIDIGHTVRIGADLLASTEKYFDRLLDIHMKDVTEASPKGHEIQVGRGIINIPGFLRILVKNEYSGVVSFEYEGEPDNPLPGMSESVAYTRRVLAEI